MRFKQTLMFKRLQLFFSVFMALYPILCIYTGFYKFTIGDLGLMFFGLLGLLSLPKIDSRFRITIVFLVYTTIVFLVNLMIVQTMQISAFTSFFFRLIKLWFYLISAFTCGRTYFNTLYFQKAIVKISVFVSVFLLFQYIAYYGAGQVFLGRIPGLTIYIENYRDIDYEALYLTQFRPCSFFLEPAQFSQFMVVPTTLVLFSDGMGKWKKLFLVMLFTACMFLSTSGQGVFYLGIVFAMFGLYEKRKKSVRIGLLAGIVLVCIIAYLRVDVVEFTVDRLLFGTDALEARVGTYKYIMGMNDLHMLFGYGYGVVPVDDFFAGVPYVWYGCGLLGFLLVLCMFFSMYKKAMSVSGKIFCLVFFAAFFITSLFYNYMLFWYITIILSTKSHREVFANFYDVKEA